MHKSSAFYLPHTPADVIRTWQHAPRIRSMIWNDLKTITTKQKAFEITLCLPWLVSEWLLLSFDTILPAMITSFFFFLTGLRQVHQGFHHTLGIGRHATNWFLVIQSGLMLGAMHAIKFHHLQHHCHCMGPEDYEAASARLEGRAIRSAVSAFAALPRLETRRFNLSPLDGP